MTLSHSTKFDVLNEALNSGPETAYQWLIDNSKNPLSSDIKTYMLDYLSKIHILPRLIDYVPGKQVSDGNITWTLESPLGLIPEKMLLVNGKGQKYGFIKPEIILRLGVFGGSFLKDMMYEIPIEWVMWIVHDGKFSLTPDPEINFHKVLSIQNKEENDVTDKLGWFQWYIRYYLGRRIQKEDDFQIRRSISFIKRHVAQIKINSTQNRKRQRQACLQWGYLYR